MQEKTIAIVLSLPTCAIIINSNTAMPNRTYRRSKVTIWGAGVFVSESFINKRFACWYVVRYVTNLKFLKTLP